MLANRQKALDWVFQDEGGFVIRDSEPGRAGNFGIGFSVFAAWEALNGKPHVTFADLKDMDIKEATAIYENQWMAPLKFDELPSGVDYSLFDCGVTLGVSGAIKMLQKSVLGFRDEAIDGHFTMLTLLGVKAYTDPKVLILAICNAWLPFKEASVDPAEIPEYHLGWAARSMKRRTRALTMVV